MLKTEGVVLKELRYRDTSKILSIYTKRYGKIAVMARGAYRPKSQMIANTQPFSYNEYNLYKGKNFFYLNQGYIMDSFYSIRERIERVTYGYYILELIEKSLPEEQENEKIFKLLIKGLTVLSTLEKDYLKFIVAYELKFISFLGYKPYLDKCVVCGCPSKDNIKFSIYEGGIICDKCFITDPFGIYINKEIYKVMYNLLYTPFEKIFDMVIPNDIIYKIHDMIVEYILYNIDRKKFNTLDLIKTLE
ncbi:DNA repair protein RecO [Tissierella praeacuta]|uniref:DNA repair protein RecO n=1 Tax=Tissierella praeacuta TaxID=43131 RepID=UPI00333EB111